MRRIIVRTLAMTALMVGISTIASASPVTHLLDPNITVHAVGVERVAYYRNHNRYAHRSWDKAHRRWRYY